MLRLSSRRAAVALSAGATLLAVGAAALPAQAAAIPGWRVNAAISVRNQAVLVTGVTAVTARDAWSTGIAITSKGAFTPEVRHWTGKSWAAVKLPAKVARSWASAEPIQTTVGASSASNVWIFGGLQGAAYVRLNGSRWSVGHLPGNNPAAGKIIEINAVTVLGRSDVWAFGATDDVATDQPTETPYAAHFNGSRWTVTHVPGDSGIIAASAASANSIWAVAGTPASSESDFFGGSAGQQTVLHWGPKGGWQQVAEPALPAATHLSGVVFEAGKVVVGGSEPNGRKGRSPLLITWNGKAWSKPSVAGASTTKWDLAGLAADGRGGFWVDGAAQNGSGSGKIWHVTGGKWSAVKPNFGKHAWVLFRIAAVPHTDSVWGAGATEAGKLTTGLIAVAGPTPR
jgi:hypothetical protein